MIGPVATCFAGRFRGVVQHDVAVFRGIPYAEAPEGDLRSSVARRRAPMTGEFAATEWGSTPQRGRPYAETVIPEPSIEGGPDILTLNVFAPVEPFASDPSSHRAPVVVWIHGGGYVSGSPASPWYDGSALARRGVLVVSISYRLGFLGFGETPSSSSNRALSDWMCALRWVQDNISAFGGDPDRVTVAGQSAGGGAVLTLLASPSAEDLFSRAIALSPADLSVSESVATDRARRLAELCGVALDDIWDVDALRLQTASVALAAETRDRAGLAFAPVHGGRLLPLPPPDGLALHGLSKPLLLGSTRDEFSPTPVTAPGERHALSDTLIHSSCTRTVRARTTGVGTWLYRFDWATPVRGTAGHCVDVPFFLGTTAAAEDVLGAEVPGHLAATMSDDFASFVHGDDPPWQSSTGTTHAVRVYSDPLRSPDTEVLPA